MSAKTKVPDKASILTKARVLSALACALTGFLGWYFTNCYEERKNAIPEMVNAFADSRATHDQMSASMTAALRAQYLFADNYLKDRNVIDAAVLQRQYAQITSLYREAEDDCNKNTRAMNRYADAQDTISKLFLTWSDRKLVIERSNQFCVLWEQQVMNVRTFDPALLSDKTQRDAYVDDVEKAKGPSEEVIRLVGNECEECSKNMTDELKYAEDRRFSVKYTCWDCARKLFEQF
jgi:hypothetical protein